MKRLLKIFGDKLKRLKFPLLRFCFSSFASRVLLSSSKLLAQEIFVKKSLLRNLSQEHLCQEIQGTSLVLS